MLPCGNKKCQVTVVTSTSESSLEVAAVVMLKQHQNSDVTSRDVIAAGQRLVVTVNQPVAAVTQCDVIIADVIGRRGVTGRRQTVTVVQQCRQGTRIGWWWLFRCGRRTSWQVFRCGRKTSWQVFRCGRRTSWLLTGRRDLSEDDGGIL